MRLINASNMEMEEFFDASRPQYAIVSHSWDEGELARQKPGWLKIENAARITQEEALVYFWIDTCCVDKTSSAELQEAINSMYAWYKESDVCFAFLSDTRCPRMTDTFCNPDLTRLEPDVAQSLVLQISSSTGIAAKEILEGDKPYRKLGNTPWSVLSQCMTSSKWFTRGWTLQELIAPSKLEFFDQSFTWIGDKHELSETINVQTGIDSSILKRGRNIHALSVAQRMSWAAGRKTSRIEDRAYSLLGIFDVNMPMIYGEGQKAFSRLQEEIIKASDDDDSFFAWETMPRGSSHKGTLLAPSPDCFEHAGDIVAGGRPGPFELTNGGLRIELLIRKAFAKDGIDHPEFAALLNCHHKQDTTGTLALRLIKPEASEQFYPVTGSEWNRLAFDRSAGRTLGLPSSLQAI